MTYTTTGWPTKSGKPPRHYYGIYPHSVLNTTTPQWRNRRRQLRESGIAGNDILGREHVRLYHGEEHQKINGGKSSFDPVLADLMYQWYAPHGGHVVDPFAGGITRGALAVHHDMTYEGVDLSQQQVKANRSQAAKMRLNGVTWDVGDAVDWRPQHTADMILTCPPYHNLERYSDDPRDLSVMKWEEHLNAIEAVLTWCFDVLKDDRFLVWVTGDVRTKNSGSRLLPERTALIAQGVGFSITNTHNLVNSVGTRYLLARKQWTMGRVALRIDQRVIVMAKGDCHSAAEMINDAYIAHHMNEGTSDPGSDKPQKYAKPPARKE